MKYFLTITIGIMLMGCGSETVTNQEQTNETIVKHNDNTTSTANTSELIIDNGEGTINNQDTEKPQRNTVRADVTYVSTTGTENNYVFSVSLKSTETGCNQYADWWEILDEDGILIYRRVLGHSHPNEQPFTRSGTSIDIQKDAKVYIRAHMNHKGYVGDIFEGSVEGGFSLNKNTISFNRDIALQEPLPSTCAF